MPGSRATADALEANEVRGFRLFTGKAGCVLCHVGWRFTDDRFHDIGLPGHDAGRGAVAGGTPGLPAFKTPSLRELAYTAPYMHDGSLADAGRGRGALRRYLPQATVAGAQPPAPPPHGRRARRSHRLPWHAIERGQPARPKPAGHP